MKSQRSPNKIIHCDEPYKRDPEERSLSMLEAGRKDLQSTMDTMA